MTDRPCDRRVCKIERPHSTAFGSCEPAAAGLCEQEQDMQSSSHHSCQERCESGRSSCKSILLEGAGRVFLTGDKAVCKTTDKMKPIQIKSVDRKPASVKL